ncbi:gamma-glutamyltransferase [Patiriisocius hiemis]|uniref:Glutathione hydrolase proenzyme n=1 Tax=Patiriisocius hiemis TaxID=3075604 RepID=A0ABU2YEK9_9FLAO|nr:gamma-glutamyltransferase [Constantimarinum sp. W242]MDT0556621.1 gamma-glutamyltransferase [Constantimarinum sp. W242]
MKSYLSILIVFLLIGCKDKPRGTQVISEKKLQKEAVLADNAIVVSATKEASQVGVEIMRMGGNAYDAAIAVEMALAVTYPYAGNLGGGGFLVYRTEYGEIGSIDYREKAPLTAHRDMYLDEDGIYKSKESKVGSLAVGVPGTVAGIFAIHEKLGSLPMEVLLQPVIKLAREGFTVTENQAIRLENYQSIFKEVNQEASIFTETHTQGSIFKNEALAKTLEAIAKNGRQEFYNGETAKNLVNYIQKKGGIITLKDLEAYEAEWREPIVFDFKEYKVISMAPPSSGGVCLAQILKMVEPYPLVEYGHNSTKYIQTITEAERRAYADRSYYLGDPDFVNIPVDSLLTSNYIKNRMQSFSLKAASPSSEIKPGSIQVYESEETTHFSIVDRWGNAASVTTTLNSGYGSKLYVKELGFFLNNEMDDFSAKPGEPNIYGLVGGEANAIAPQKRMLSSMTPTILEKDGELFMVVGTPGGATIITSVAQTILNVIEFNMDMQEAVNAPRFHHQWLPDNIRYEVGRFPKKIKDSLKILGYPENITADPIIGKVDAIRILENGVLEGGADPRGDDTAVGY